MKQRIYYHHTDCGGVVYYANYLKFFEEARTEYFEEKGVMIGTMMKEGLLIVVARQEVDYKAPCVYGDILNITTKVVEVSGVKIIFENEIYNQNNKLTTKGRTICVTIGKNMRPIAVPDDVKAKLLK